MQGASSVLRYLADRESADVHAPPRQIQRFSQYTAEVSSELSSYTVSGLSRFYKEQLKKTDVQFREKYDITCDKGRQ